MEFINETILDLFLLFFVYSFLGWVLESAYRSFGAKKFINSGFLFGPILPIFGFSALVAILFWYIFNFNIHLAVLAGVLFINTFEYFTALLSEKLFGLKLWDYSNLRFHYKGRVSLESSIIWAFLLYILLAFLHPAVVAELLLIPFFYKELFLFFALVFIGVDFTVSLIETMGLRRVLTMNLPDIKKYIAKYQNRDFRVLQVFPDLYKAVKDLVQK